jgi:LPS export ABC transporter protein LptC
MRTPEGFDAYSHASKSARRMRSLLTRKACVLLRIVCISYSVFLIPACSLDYESLNQIDAMPEDVPRSVIYHFNHTLVDNGKPSFRLSASKAEEFSDKKTTILSDVSFVEYDAEGTVMTTGKAARTVFHTDTENAELSGSLVFRSKRDDSTIHASSLSWNNEKKTLTAAADDTVRIEKGNGSTISGKGFIANTETRIVNFAGGAEGTYVLNDTTHE